MEKGSYKPKWGPLICLLARTGLNIGFISTVIMALSYASIAGINQGIMSTLLAMYTVYVAIIFYYMFNETLGFKFIAGIVLVLSGVAITTIEKELGGSKMESDETYFIKAIFYGLMSPLLISIFIALSRFTSTKYNYPANDLQLDTMIVLGIVGCPFMINFWMTNGYTNY